LAIASNNDVALLEVAQRQAAYLPLQAMAPHLGEGVFSIGCPSGLSHAVTTGRVRDPARVINGKRLIEMNSEIKPGNSGGPLINHRGNVVGLIYGYLKGGPSGRIAAPDGAIANNGLAIPADDLIGLMRSAGLDLTALAAPEIKRLWEGAQATSDARARAAVYEEITARAPWLPEALYNKGGAYYELARYSEARATYEAAVRQRSDYYQAYTNLGLTLFRLGEHRAARDALLKAIAIEPRYALAYLNLGIVYEQGLGDRPSAQRAFRRLIELEPDSQEASEVRRWIEE
jgi:hypothetical protein